MSRSQFLKKNREFRRVYARGRSYATRHVVMYVYHTGGEGRRAGFVVSKKIGKAVIRNRIKRIFREVYRLSLRRLTCGVDLIFIARRGIEREADYRTVEREFFRLYKKAGLLRGERADD